LIVYFQPPEPTPLQVSSAVRIAESLSSLCCGIERSVSLNGAAYIGILAVHKLDQLSRLSLSINFLEVKPVQVSPLDKISCVSAQ
jgi:hypothetical protein